MARDAIEVMTNELKIDMSFVANMINDPKDQRIVRPIISLAHGFGLSVVAEGAETSASLQAMRDLGCNYAQGFLFGKPMTEKRFQAWLRNYQRRERPWLKG